MLKDWPVIKSITESGPKFEKRKSQDRHELLE